MPLPSRSEQTTVRAAVAATPEVCFAIATDLESYPEWAQGVTAAEVLERDSEGRPTRAAFRAEAVGRRTRYVLAYDHSLAPKELSWRLVEGDVMRELDGSYRFEPSADSPGVTDVTYQLAIDLAVPLPGFVKRRAEAKIVTAALRHFCRRVEVAR